MMFLIYLLIFISFWDLFGQLPITSTYAQSLGAAVGFIGFISGAYSFSNLFSNIFSGYFVDKSGPKKVLAFGFFINALFLIGYGLVNTPEQLFIVRLLNGFSSGVLTPAAFTYATLYSKSKSSGKTMAYAGAAVGLAAITGPATSGILSSMYGPEIVYFILGGAMIIGGLVTLIFLKPLERKPSEKGKNHISTKHDIINLFKNPGVVLGYIGAFTLAVAQGILAYMLPLKTVELDFGDRTSGMMISVYGIVAILFFLLPTNRIYDKFKNQNVSPIAMLLIGCTLMILGIAQNIGTMYLAMAIYGIGFAMLFPANMGLVATHSDPEIRGKAFGLLYGFISLGSVVGSFVTGSFSLSTTEAFIAAAIFISIVGIIVLLTVRKAVSELSN